MLILKDIVKRILSNKIALICMTCASLFASSLISFTLSGYDLLGHHAELIRVNSIGDIVITSAIINGDDSAVLDNYCYSNGYRQYDNNDYKNTLIDVEKLLFLSSDWIDSYSGRLRGVSDLAMCLLPFENFHLLSKVAGVDFQELIEFDKSLSGVSIPLDKKTGIILPEVTISLLHENGIDIQVGDMLRVEGDAFFMPTVSWDLASPYLYLELIAIIPDSGGNLNAGTEDRHTNVICYVDYESMQSIIGIKSNRKPTGKEAMEDLNTDLSIINIDKPSIPKQPIQIYPRFPNQLFIRINDKIKLSEAIEIINNELEGYSSGFHKYIAITSNEYLNLGHYNNSIYDEEKRIQSEFLMSVIFI